MAATPGTQGKDASVAEHMMHFNAKVTGWERVLYRMLPCMEVTLKGDTPEAKASAANVEQALASMFLHSLHPERYTHLLQRQGVYAKSDAEKSRMFKTRAEVAAAASQEEEEAPPKPPPTSSGDTSALGHAATPPAQTGKERRRTARTGTQSTKAEPTELDRQREEDGMPRTCRYAGCKNQHEGHTTDECRRKIYDARLTTKPKAAARSCRSSSRRGPRKTKQEHPRRRRRNNTSQRWQQRSKAGSATKS